MNTCQYPECERPLENIQLDYCASHNLERRKMERQAIKEVEKKKLITSKLRELKPKKQKALAKHSDNVHYEDSNGIRYSSKEIEKNIHDAKAKKLADMMYKHDYWFCEECKTTQSYLDNAHIVSVDQCKKKGMVEYAWDINNIRLLCRSCHQLNDRLGLQWNCNNPN